MKKNAINTNVKQDRTRSGQTAHCNYVDDYYGDQICVRPKRLPSKIRLEIAGRDNPKANQ